MTERYFRRLTSIPPRTSIDVLRGGITIRLGGGNLLGGVRRRVSQDRPSAGETNWDQTVAKHVFQKPPRRERVRPEPSYERERKIECEAEVIEDYNGMGDLGIVLEFTGIGLTRAPFLRSKHNRPDSPVFYIPIGYKNGVARLFLSTKGDIVNSQIVPAEMDVNPFFQEELYLLQLAPTYTTYTPTYNPASMAVWQNNGLVIVSYNRK